MDKRQEQGKTIQKGKKRSEIGEQRTWKRKIEKTTQLKQSKEGG